MKKTVLASLVATSVVTLGLTHCGKKSDSNDSPAPTAQPNQNSNATPASFSITSKTSFIASRSSNGSIVESYALFAIKPNMSGLSILDVTLDGASLSTATSGFSSATITKGSISASSVQPMAKGQVGLSSDQKASLVASYQDALYVYSEGHTFDFNQSGTVHKVKISVGSSGNKAGEYEFVIDNSSN